MKYRIHCVKDCHGGFLKRIDGSVFETDDREEAIRQKERYEKAYSNVPCHCKIVEIGE